MRQPCVRFRRRVLQPRMRRTMRVVRQRVQPRHVRRRDDATHALQRRRHAVRWNLQQRQPDLVHLSDVVDDLRAGLLQERRCQGPIDV